MYSRRGDLKNLKYILNLRNYLRKLGIISITQMIAGDVIMISNVIIPSTLREKIYKRFLHKGA